VNAIFTFYEDLCIYIYIQTNRIIKRQFNLISYINCSSIRIITNILINSSYRIFYKAKHKKYTLLGNKNFKKLRTHFYLRYNYNVWHSFFSVYFMYKYTHFLPYDKCHRRKLLGCTSCLFLPSLQNINIWIKYVFFQENIINSLIEI